ncbi:MAG: winged helix-turn-helix transcriptional regulator [Thermoleophilaceae bacterium]|jgi:predicted Rossmann fold nucleotide-binding protein DprA/Smf involved in DNA uptake
MADFLDETRKGIETRLRELKPLVDEYNRLEQASRALAGVGGAQTSTQRRRNRRPAAGRRRRGRPRGSGTRSIQALELVKAKPGITIRELADSMGIKANYLYRVLPTLEQEGKVKRRNGGWHAA